MREVPYEIQKDLLSLITLASPEKPCFYKRRFIQTWEDRGLNAALEEWLTSPFPEPGNSKILDAVAMVHEVGSTVFAPSRR
jgi:hypothetical protein